MNCTQCEKPFTTASVRMRTELRGICIYCAKENNFAGMTLEEVARCVSFLKAIEDYENSTFSQRRHLKDMES